jgi:hypothetical protein
MCVCDCVCVCVCVCVARLCVSLARYNTTNCAALHLCAFQFFCGNASRLSHCSPHKVACSHALIVKFVLERLSSLTLQPPQSGSEHGLDRMRVSFWLLTHSHKVLWNISRFVHVSLFLRVLLVAHAAAHTKWRRALRERRRLVSRRQVSSCLVCLPHTSFFLVADPLFSRSRVA